MVGVKHRVRRAPTGEFLAFQYNGASIKSESGMPRLPNRDAKASAVAQPKLLDAAMKIAKGIFRMSDEGESKLRPLPPCLLPVHNPSLEPEHYKGPGLEPGVDPGALRPLWAAARYTRSGTLRSS